MWRIWWQTTVMVQYLDTKDNLDAVIVQLEEGLNRDT